MAHRASSVPRSLHADLELVAAPRRALIRAWIDTWNENPRRFVWTKSADEILESIRRYRARITES
jgi:hypothetical protein